MTRCLADVIESNPIRAREFSLAPDRKSRGVSAINGIRSEPGRTLGGDLEYPFQCHPHRTQCPFVEQTTDQCDAMRNAAWRRELRKGMGGVRSPIAARLGNFYEAGSKCERRVAGEVTDRQHLIAERRCEQQIHIREDAHHLLRYTAPQ